MTLALCRDATVVGKGAQNLFAGGSTCRPLQKKTTNAVGPQGAIRPQQTFLLTSSRRHQDRPSTSLRPPNSRRLLLLLHGFVSGMGRTTDASSS